MSRNDTAVVSRRATPEYEAYATAVTLHASAASAYRRALHRHGALHPTTVAAQAHATIVSFFLADSRTRLYRVRAARAAA